MHPCLMTHMVAGYPNMTASLEIARALIAGGASILELQFPFTDPSADGPIIQAACTQALHAGFRVDQGWALAKTLRREFPAIPLFIMSYASIVVAKGVDAFCAQAAQAGVSGLIIPDLAPGADEGLYQSGKAQQLAIVPVLVPSVSPQRLQAILSLNPPWVYVAIRAGITGARSMIGPQLKDFLGQLSRQTRVMAGFGIESPDQVQELQPYAHAIVVGSALVRNIAAHAPQGLEAITQALKAQTTSLCGIH